MDPVPPTSLPSVSPTPPIEPQPKSKLWMWIMAGISLLGIGIVAGIFLGKQLYSIPQPQPIPTPSPSEASAKESDPTANWKTFISADKLFFISYPSEWQLDEANGISIAVKGYLVGQIVVHNKADQNYVNEIWKSVPCGGGSEGCSPLSYKEIKSTYVNGRIVYWKIDGSDTIHAYIPNTIKNKTVEIDFPNGTGQPTIDQILSTFKFVDQATPKPTCKPRPACLDATPRCMIAETSDMCPPNQKL